jgi:hypothetical protein
MSLAYVAIALPAFVAIFILGYRCGLKDGREMERHEAQVKRMLETPLPIWWPEGVSRDR